MGAKTRAMMPRWNEHFAGVVAKDQGDTVTLENYNRAIEAGPNRFDARVGHEGVPDRRVAPEQEVRARLAQDRSTEGLQACKINIMNARAKP